MTISFILDLMDGTDGIPKRKIHALVNKLSNNSVESSVDGELKPIKDYLAKVSVPEYFGQPRIGTKIRLTWKEDKDKDDYIHILEGRVVPKVSKTFYGKIKKWMKLRISFRKLI